MTQVTLDVSAIICAYTEARWYDLVAAVESLRRQSKPPSEIIVVVDHNQRLLERVRAELSGVMVVESNGPQGLSGARNSGIAVARGTRIAFLDDDAAAEPDWLARLYQYFDDPRVLAVGGTVEPVWPSKPPIWFPNEFYWIVGCSYQNLPGTPMVVRNPFGGCVCYRREVFEVVGGFRTGIGRIGTLPMGCDETELCIRASQRWPQKVFLIEPQARIHHRIPPSRACWRYFRSRCYAEGLSKAIVTQHVGAKDSLASERAYTLRTLPRGVLCNMKNSIIHRDRAGFQRAGVIVAGLIITTIGYLVGTFSRYLGDFRRAIASNEALPELAGDSPDIK